LIYLWILVIITALAPKNGWQAWTRICTPERNRPEFTDRNKTRESEFVRSDIPDVTGSRTRIGVRNFVKSDICRSNNRSSTTWRRTPSCWRPGSLSVKDICKKKKFWAITSVFKFMPKSKTILMHMVTSGFLAFNMTEAGGVWIIVKNIWVYCSQSTRQSVWPEDWKKNSPCFWEK